MSIKFTTPVSMQVTKEQYEKDLKEPLLKMGYKEYCFTWNLSKSQAYLCTNIADVHNQVSELRLLYKDNNRYRIGHYNPELFLALAGMREDKEIKVGDWVAWETKLFGKEVHMMHNVDIMDYTPLNIRKATKEEIIHHFTKQEWQEPKHSLGDKIFIENPEPIFRKGDTVWHWRHGKGEIKKIEHGKNIYVLFDQCEFGSAWILVADIELSFTPYDLKDGGFSQERPGHKIEKGAFVRAENTGRTLIVSHAAENVLEGIDLKTGEYSKSWFKSDFKPIENPIK